MRYGTVLLLAVVLAVFCGCATLISSPQDYVLIKVNPPSATVSVNGVNITGEGRVSVSRQNDLVVYNENGQIIKTVYRTFNVVSILNVFFWPGFIVDFLTGAIYDFAPVVVIDTQPGSKTLPVRPEGPLP
jgi:hypothetical protein